MAKRIIWLSFVAVFLFSCKKKEIQPEGLIPKDKFETVMKEVLIVNAAVVSKGEVNEIDSLLADTLFSKVFSKYDVNVNDFKKTLSYYEKNPTMLNEVMDSILARMNQER